LYVAAMMTLVEEVTAFVVKLKLAAELPAGTLTLAGTIADELLLDSPTRIPPVGAGLFKVTVPVDGLPPVTAAGFRDTDDNASVGLMISWVFLLTPL
jgi:hypothetical protein